MQKVEYQVRILLVHWDWGAVGANVYVKQSISPKPRTERSSTLGIARPHFVFRTLFAFLDISVVNVGPWIQGLEPTCMVAAFIHGVQG